MRVNDMHTERSRKQNDKRLFGGFFDCLLF